jgi:hypothetical protein
MYRQNNVWAFRTGDHKYVLSDLDAFSYSILEEEEEEESS